MILEKNYLKNIIKKAILEDISQDNMSLFTDRSIDIRDYDITSKYLIANNYIVDFEIKTRDDIILCGIDIVKMIFEVILEQNNKINDHLSTHLQYNFNYNEGDFIEKNNIILSGSLDIKSILFVERIILNYLQYLTGIATKTYQFKIILNNGKIRILDTRKTFPLMRNLQKYAVNIGGGKNHRFSLNDMILIKDNHIIANKCDNNKIIQLIKEAKNNVNNIKIEIESNNLYDIDILSKIADIDIIMLDNMGYNDMKKAINIIRSNNKNIKIEISGNINKDKIIKIRDLDIDYISIGSLTHSFVSSDLTLKIK